MATVSELLPSDAVLLDAEAEDWRAAVRLAGELMARTGTGTADYTAEMIRNVEENGPYIVIAPGFALAHARPSPAVLRTGMSWVRLAGPVEFGHESNDPVELVVGLAAEDQDAHRAALAGLARLLADPATARALKEAATPDALLAVLAGRPGDAGSETGTSENGSSETGSSEAGSSETGSSETGSSETGSRVGEEDAGGAGTTARRSGAAGVHKILTVCGNGLGTSLFLKNTLEQVLQHWGWSTHVTVEATDTVSAKGKASEAVAVFTSREIASALAGISVPVRIIEDFTSTAEVDGALRDTYDV
ncbi:PTS sugar transporter subunit IIA [Streptomyces sp. WMMB 322]|uniref:PTS sugar transporter subunit IIA n=1 Tax=Streptomyces sp. WMMB 322 TaxID=1286821 RepID=UPI0006E1F05D|nr:PTS sugar transporter subunit IIA [Streptomyces sp. WMMB 322]SCK45467.1 PTS system IIA component, L-Asc family /PTS system IIB component, L-Asc family [Streptomyces sp. WMMB 322]